MANTARAAIELGAGARVTAAPWSRANRASAFELRMIALFDDDSFDLRAVGPHGLTHGLQPHHEAHW